MMERYRGPYTYQPIVCGEVVIPTAHLRHAVDALTEARGRPPTIADIAAALETTEGEVAALIVRIVRRRGLRRAVQY